MVKSLAERAEKIRNALVDSSVDNMLKVTNDGRKLALDQRLMNELLPDDQGSKVNACVERAYEIWRETETGQSAQLIFSDLSTPRGDGSYNVYDDVRKKLVERGVPPEQVAFIHEYNTEAKKADLFAKVRSGKVRFLLGSTSKMGAGTNVQDKLIALHHMDCPWRPADLEQREGRIIRQGNTNPQVRIFRYVMENTFDSYQWQLIENKQRFIGQIMTSKSPVRSCEDVDETALTYAEVKALATGNPYIKEKMSLDMEVSKLKLAKSEHMSQIYRLEDSIAKNYPMKIAALKENIEGYKADIETVNEKMPPDKEHFSMEVAGSVYTERKEAGAAIIDLCTKINRAMEPVEAGQYAGMKLSISFDPFERVFTLTAQGKMGYAVHVGTDATGNITKINNALLGIGKKLEEAETTLANVEHQLETAKEAVKKPFEHEEELDRKLVRLAELNALLNMDEKGNDAVLLDECAEPDKESSSGLEGKLGGENISLDNPGKAVNHADQHKGRSAEYTNAAKIDRVQKVSEPSISYQASRSGMGIKQTDIKKTLTRDRKIPFRERLAACNKRADALNRERKISGDRGRKMAL